jgi:two-component system cell cycle sensor histidine kinase/response regulator CckA
MATSSTSENGLSMPPDPDASRAGADQLRGLVDGLPVLIWTARPDGFVDSCNRRWCEYTGMTREQSLGSGWMAAVHPDDLGTTREAIREAFELGNSYEVEQRLRRHDGTYRWFLVRGSPIRDATGKVLHWDGANVDINERKEAEQALRSSEERVRIILKSSMAGFWMVDSAGRLMEVNEAYCRMSGYSAEELTTMRVSDLETLESASATAAHIEKVLTLGQDRFESRHRRKDGSEFDVEISVQHQTEEGGYMAAFLEDITDRKRSEQRLKAEMANSDAIFEASPVAMLILDETTNIVRANAASVVMLGGTRSDLLQHRPGNAMRCVHSSKDPRGCGYSKECRLCELRNGIEGVIAGGGPRHGVELTLVLTRDGKPRKVWLELGAEEVALNGRRHLCVALSDITERKRAVEALRDGELKYRALFETADDAVLLFAGEGWTDCNRAASRVFGCTREQIIGAHPAAFSPPTQPDGRSSKEESIKAIELAFTTGPQFFEWTHRRGDGTTFPAEVDLRRLDLAGKPHIQAIVRDVTERKRAEAEREKLEEQHRASQKLEAIGSLAGGVAHDFNNILSVILSYTDFAMDALREGDALKSDLLEVKKAGERAAVLTRQLLAFSRKQVMRPAPLDLNQVATGLEKMLQRILGEDILIAQKLAPDLGLALADRGQIEQVLMNLAVNARDAMPKGGSLTIETSNVDVDEELAVPEATVKPGPYVQLAVSDTGCGMDQRTQARIFEPFFTTKEQGKGTGLGLSTVYGIVKQSGGHIWVFSGLGLGTTFRIYLPRELVATTEATVKPSTAPRPPRGTETVLVVDDESALLKIATRSLEAAGYTVLTAASGQEALVTSAHHAGDIHLLLTDVVMPRMSGGVLAQELSKTRPTIKVVYMSGYTDSAIVHHGVLDAGTTLLTKPFTSSDLTRKIREVLDG